MDNRLLILALVVLVALVLIWLGRYISRQKITRGRRPRSLEEIQRSLTPEVSMNTLSQVFDALGEAYGVNPKLIRPEDSLKQFFDLDSWSLDAGTERINKWLVSHGIKATKEELSTVLDLLLLVERHRSGAIHL